MFDNAVKSVLALAIILVVVGTSACAGVPFIVGFLGPLAFDLLLVSLYLLAPLLLLTILLFLASLLLFASLLMLASLLLLPYVQLMHGHQQVSYFEDVTSRSFLLILSHGCR